MITTLNAPNPGEIDNFGHSIVINEDFVIIGDRFAGVDGFERAGEVYVYNKLGEHMHTIRSPEPSSGANFGFSLDVYEDILVIGEPHSDKATVDAGMVYVYNVDGSLISELESSDPIGMGLFGDTVYMSDGLIMVREVGSKSVHIFSTEASVVETQSEVPMETVASEDEEPSGGIPGYPSISLLIGLATFTLVLIFNLKNKRTPLLFSYF